MCPKDRVQDQFIRTLYVPRKIFFLGGGFRPIYNLRKLNNVDYKHFKIKGFQEVKNIMINSDLFRKNDLTGTYVCIPIHQSYRK